MRLCKHDDYKVIDWIKSPKWSTDVIKINVDAVPSHIENYLIRFTDESPKKKYGWFYMSGKMIRRHKVVPNGTGRVYEVPLSKREEFEKIDNCEHLIK